MNFKNKVLLLPTLFGLSGAIFGTMSLYATKAEAFAGCAHTNPYVIPDCPPQPPCEYRCGTLTNGGPMMCNRC